MTAMSVQLSVIVPVGSRYDDVSAVLDAYRTMLDGLGVEYELIYVLDGPQPDVLEVLRAEQTRHASLEILQLARSFGEATAIVAGFEVSRGAMIATLPAYFQVDPRDRPFARIQGRLPYGSGAPVAPAGGSSTNSPPCSTACSV